MKMTSFPGKAGYASPLQLTFWSTVPSPKRDKTGEDHSSICKTGIWLDLLFVVVEVTEMSVGRTADKCPR